MTWDKNNGMYYRTRRKGRKVIREYYGNGDAARLAAALDDDKRQRKQDEITVVKSLRQRWNDACEPLDRIREGSLLLLRAVRLTVKSHRVQDGDSAMNNANPGVIHELRELVALGNKGDKSVLPRVQQLLNRHTEITNYFGDAATVATELWISLYAGHDVLMVEATRRQMVSLRLLIAGPAPSPLESLMIEQIIVCWLQVNATLALHAQALAEKACPAIVRERQRQAEASQRLYDSGIKQLAELRKLLAKPEEDGLAMHLRIAVGASTEEAIESHDESPSQATPIDTCDDRSPVKMNPPTRQEDNE